jgi:hypothetical protein
MKKWFPILFLLFSAIFLAEKGDYAGNRPDAPLRFQMKTVPVARFAALEHTAIPVRRSCYIGKNRLKNI